MLIDFKCIMTLNGEKKSICEHIFNYLSLKNVNTILNGEKINIRADIQLIVIKNVNKMVNGEKN